MAPLFFALLAEGSLAWRRQKLEKAAEAISLLDKVGRQFAGGALIAENATEAENDSIANADVFGERLFSNSYETIVDEPFDPTKENPFASYLRKLKDAIPKDGLPIPKVVEVDSGDLCFGSPPKFPDYDLCSDELDRIANGSLDARKALETGHARLSEIPDELTGEERGKWLENKLPNIYKDLGKAGNVLAKHVATTSDESRKLVEQIDTQRDNCETDTGGDDQ